MTGAEFRRCIELLWGHGSQTRAAEQWGVAVRSIRRFVSGEQPVPAGIARDLRDMIGIMPPPGTDADDDADTPARDDACLDAIEPEMTRLRDRCVSAGWSPAEIAVAMVSISISEIIAHAGVAAALDFLDETKAAIAEQQADAPPRVDIRGARFGSLVAIEPVEVPERQGSWWRLVCDCGGEQIAPLSRLRIADDDKRAIRACEACRARKCSICGAPYLKAGSTATCGAEACRLEHRRRVNAEIADRRHAANPTARLERQRRYRATEAGSAAAARWYTRYYELNRLSKLEADRERRRAARSNMTDEERGALRHDRAEYYREHRDLIREYQRQWREAMSPERRAEWNATQNAASRRYRRRLALAKMMADARALIDMNEVQDDE